MLFFIFDLTNSTSKFNKETSSATTDSLLGGSWVKLIKNKIKLIYTKCHFFYIWFNKYKSKLIKEKLNCMARAASKQTTDK